MGCILTEALENDDGQHFNEGWAFIKKLNQTRL